MANGTTPYRPINNHLDVVISRQALSLKAWHRAGSESELGKHGNRCDFAEAVDAGDRQSNGGEAKHIAHRAPGRQIARTIVAELGLSSILPNTSTARTFAKAGIGELDLTESVGVVRKATQAVQAGNLSGLEATLTAQAVALDAIFNEMARRAALNIGEYINATEVYLRLGLKAQAQCRATLQTLFEMKNPQPIAFVKQANIANGPQQVNNGGRAADPSARAEIPAKRPNELLGLNHEQRLDT
jgi:hypothetical protein